MWRMFWDQGIWPLKISSKCECISQGVMCSPQACAVDNVTNSVDTVSLLSQHCQWIHESNVHSSTGNEDYLWFQQHEDLINGHVATALINVQFCIISNWSGAPWKALYLEEPKNYLVSMCVRRIPVVLEGRRGGQQQFFLIAVTTYFSFVFTLSSHFLCHYTICRWTGFLMQGHGIPCKIVSKF